MFYSVKKILWVFLLGCVSTATEAKAGSLPEKALDISKVADGQAWYPRSAVVLDTMIPERVYEKFSKGDYPLTNKVFKTGDASEPYWAPMTIANGSGKEVQKYFDFLDTFFESVHVFRKTENSYEEIYSSGRLSHRTRQEFELWPGFSLKLKAGETADLMIRYEASINVTPKIYIHNEASHTQWKIKGYLIAIGGSFLALGMLAYSLLLFMRLKQFIYLVHAFFILIVGAMNAINVGLLDSLFTVGKPYFFFHFISVFYPLTHLSIYFVGKDFLELEKNDPFSNRVFTYCIYFSSAMVLLAFVGIYSHKFQAVYIGISGIFYMTAVFRAVARGYMPAKLYSLGAGIFAGTCFIWGLVLEGLMEGNLFSRYAPIYGLGVNAALFSLSIGDRLWYTEMLRMEKEIKEHEAQSLEKLINVICHDFGNPLSVVKGNVLMMQRYPERSTEKVYSVLFKAIEQMQSIITDTHALQAYKQGRLNIDLKPVNLKDCVDDVLLLFGHKAKVKGVGLVADEQSFDGLSVLASSNLLKSSVLGNIISNAIKFTPANGQIHISARENGDFVDICIKDNGIGMCKDSISRLFDPQANISRVGTNFEQGTGFGMPIVKAFVDSFQGEISVSSREAAMGVVDRNSGTEFIISLRKIGHVTQGQV